MQKPRRMTAKQFHRIKPLNQWALYEICVRHLDSGAAPHETERRQRCEFWW